MKRAPISNFLGEKHFELRLIKFVKSSKLLGFSRVLVLSKQMQADNNENFLKVTLRFWKREKFVEKREFLWLFLNKRRKNALIKSLFVRRFSRKKMILQDIHILSFIDHEIQFATVASSAAQGWFEVRKKVFILKCCFTCQMFLSTVLQILVR